MNINDQFTDLSQPDHDKKYYYDPFAESRGFTHLMKLVLLVRRFPDATNLIVNILKNDRNQVNKKNEHSAFK